MSFPRWPASSRARRGLISGILAMFVAAVGCSPQSRPANMPASEEIVSVERGTVAETLQVVGTLEVVREEELSFDLPAGVSVQLLTVHVEAGQQVTQGQPLAEIDPAPLDLATQEAQEKVRLAQAELDRVRAGPSPADIAAAGAEVARTRWEWLKAVRDAEALEQSDTVELQWAVDDAAHALTVARIDYELAQHDDRVGKQVRDLEYTVAWLERRIAELQPKVEGGRANREEAEELTRRQEELPKAKSDLLRAREEAALLLAGAQDAIRQAEADLAEARAALAEAQAGDESSRLERARQAAEAAELAWKGARERLEEVRAGPDPEGLAEAHEGLEEAKQALAEAQASREKIALQAPFAGVIVATPAQRGNYIDRSTIVVVVADLASMRLTAHVDEADVRDLRQGMPAEIRFEAFPQQAVNGTLGAVPLKGKSDPITSRVVFAVPLTFEAGGLPLRPGMTARVAIFVRRAGDVLRLPAMAIAQDAGGTYVLRVRPDGGQERVPVEIGISDGVYTEIRSGLAEGDQVLVTFLGQAGQGGMPGMTP